MVRKSGREQRSQSREQQQQQENVPPPCCAHMRHENELLRRALRKERERRMFTNNAYRQLLEQFNHLVDFRRVVVARGNEGGGQRQRQSLPSVGGDASGASSDATTAVPPSPSVASTAAPAMGHHQQQIVTDQPPVSHHQPRIATHEGDNKTPTQNRKSAIVVPAGASVSDQPNWYFVALERNVDNHKGDNNTQRNNDGSELIHDQRVWRMFARSQQRCNAIRDASRARAQIAAGRRAVVADLLTGRRALDSEAIDVLLHTDASRAVQAFPSSFMREQRRASQRRYERSPHRLQQERERHRHFEAAINRILAHSSATMAKMVATSQRNTSQRPH